MNFRRWFSLGFMPDGEGGGSVVETKHDLGKMSGCIREALRQGKVESLCVLRGYSPDTKQYTAGCAIGLAMIGKGIEYEYIFSDRTSYLEEMDHWKGGPGMETFFPAHYVYYAADKFGMPVEVAFEAECRFMGWCSENFGMKQPAAKVADWLESKGY